MFLSHANRIPKGLSIMLFGILVLAVLGCPRDASAVHRGSIGIEIEIGDYNYLSDYGDWFQMPGFGMVWQPYVVADWSPFYHGHWSRSYDGWAWMSYEPFGWLVYHYGYWYFQPRIGWFWIPGRMWSPARVQWYTYGNYCAWAPMPPPRHYWHDPWDWHDFNAWIVVDLNHFTNEYVGHHRIHRPFHGEKIGHRGAWMKQAPDVRHVEKITRREITPVRISRERSGLRRDADRTPARYYRPKEANRKRMVVPEREASRVREHAPKVEREVLVPKDRAPKREIQRAPARQSERKSTGSERKTIKRR